MVRDDPPPDDRPPPPRGFSPLYEKSLPYNACPELAAWSPQLDLLAVVAESNNVLLYRMNGERVWGVTVRKEAGSDDCVKKLRWRPDGKVLALGCSDGSARMYDVNNGKVIHRIASELPDFGSITCVGWVDNHSHKPKIPGAPSRYLECTPQTLFDLDIGQMMPRLSALPASAGPDSNFTSKTTLDALINAVTKGGEGTDLDIIVIGEEGGKILLNIFNSFMIGTMDIASLSQHFPHKCRLLLHAATIDLTTHSLLVVDAETNHLVLSTMDVLFIEQFGQYLFQLASISTRVQALLRYIRETITSLTAEFKTANDLEKRFLGIIEEEAKAAGSNVPLEFFELLVTGIPTVMMREWLVDTLSERGQKRWEKSSINGYETLRKLAHQNLLPACERLTVLLVRLRGLARWKESGSPLGLEPEDFTRCLDVVSGITFVTHDFLIKLNNELGLFRTFMDWLRFTLDQLSTVVNVDDKQNEDPQTDTLKIAEYIEKHLKQSTLLPFFQLGAGKILEERKERGETVMDLYAKHRDEMTLPVFQELIDFLDTLCKDVFVKPQHAMRQQLRVGKPLHIYDSDVSKHDIIMVSDGGKPVTYLALRAGQNDGDSLVFVRCEVGIEGSLSSIENIGCAKVSLSETNPRNLIDVKFVDQRLAIIIMHDKRDRISYMLTMDYSRLTYDKKPVPASAVMSESVLAHADKLDAQELIPVLQREFDSTFVPVEVNVNGKPGRRVGYVLANDQLRYQVFDLDVEDEDSYDGSVEGSMEVDE